MWYFIIILSFLVVGILTLKIRLRLVLDRDRKMVFLGLGRSGPELDFVAKVGRVRLFGLQVKTFSLSRSGKPKEPEPEQSADGKVSRKKQRRRSLADIIRILPQSARALSLYAVELFRAVMIEELDGEIEAGFDSPDITGQAYGYYQAALATVPGLAGRFSYIPDWSGASFGGSLRITATLPVHRILRRTIVLLFRLPVKDMIKLAIGSKKGASDG